jgi:ACS family glucarate transporter-like MFS transporter
VRKTSVVLGHGAIAAGLCGLTASEPSLAFKSLLLMGAGCGMCGANTFTFAQTLAGPDVAGKWVGYQNCIANLAGIVVAPLTGWIVDRTGDFRMAFLTSAVVSLLGGVAWGFGVRELKQVEWQPAGQPPAPTLEETVA